MLSLQMPWVLPEGISHVVRISHVVYHTSVGVPGCGNMWSLYIYILLALYCPGVRGEQAGDNRADVILCVTSLAQDLEENFTTTSVGIGFVFPCLRRCILLNAYINL